MPKSITEAAILDDRIRIALPIRMAYGSAAMALDPARTLAELRELQALTSDDGGAQRVCWTETWSRARSWYRERLDRAAGQRRDGRGRQPLGDASGRLRARGPDRRPLDSVSNGGWLDGCLNVLAGLEVLRRLAAEGTPAATVRLVDWADEEGFRFGRSLFGSSAVSQNLDPTTLPRPARRRGRRAPRRRSRSTESISSGRGKPGGSSRMPPPTSSCTSSRARCSSASTCRWQSCSAPTASSATSSASPASARTWARRRWTCGATPWPPPRGSCSRARRIAEAAGSVTTVGTVATPGGIVTAVAPVCELVVDQRNLSAETLAAMLAEAQECSRRIAAGGGLRGRLGAAMADPAAAVPPAADRVRRRGGARDVGDVPPDAERRAPRRGRDGERRRAHRDAVRAEPARPQPQQRGGHAAGAHRGIGPGARPPDGEDDRLGGGRVARS